MEIKYVAVVCGKSCWLAVRSLRTPKWRFCSLSSGTHKVFLSLCHCQCDAGVCGGVQCVFPGVRMPAYLGTAESGNWILNSQSKRDTKVLWLGMHQPWSFSTQAAVISPVCIPERATLHHRERKHVTPTSQLMQKETYLSHQDVCAAIILCQPCRDQERPHRKRWTHLCR